MSRDKELLELRRAGKQCWSCYRTSPPLDGYRYCEDHLDVRRERGLMETQERKARGVCSGCGRPRDGEKLTCSACREKQRILHKNRVDRGICRCGGSPLPGRKLCGTCLDKAREGNRALCASRLAVGVCIICEAPRINKALKTCGSCRAKKRELEAVKASLKIFLP